MRKYTPVLLLTLLTLLTTACLGTARITTGDSKPVADNIHIDGIPFYPKRAVCRQDTIWLEPLYVLTREDTYRKQQPPLKPTDPPPPPTTTTIKQTKIARRSELTTKQCPQAAPRDQCTITALERLDKLQKTLADAQPTIDPTKLKAINDAWTEINVTSSLLVTDVEQRNVVLASNTRTSDFFTDYTRPYYFNTRMPWLGSSTANATLDKDGSLTNGTATVDNQTLKAVLDVLPISAVLSKALGLTSTATATAPTGAGAAILGLDGGTPPTLPESITLTIETRPTHAHRDHRTASQSLRATFQRRRAYAALSGRASHEALPVPRRPTHHATASSGQTQTGRDQKGSEERPWRTLNFAAHRLLRPTSCAGAGRPHIASNAALVANCVEHTDAVSPSTLHSLRLTPRQPNPGIISRRVASLTDTIEALLWEDESTTLDFKAAQYPFAGATDDQKGEIIKDLLAFANAFRRDDAYILLGVHDQQGGRATITGVSNHLEDASLQQLVNKKTNRTLEFSYHALTIDSQQIGAIRIPRQLRPTYLKQDFGELQARTVYLRHGSSTSIASPEEIARMGADQQPSGQRYDPEITALQTIHHHARFYDRIIRLWENITRIPEHYITNIARSAEYERERRALHVPFTVDHDAFRQAMSSARDILTHQCDRASASEKAAITEILAALRDVEQTVNALGSWSNSRLDVELPRDKQRDAAEAAEHLSTLVARRLVTLGAPTT